VVLFICTGKCGVVVVGGYMVVCVDMWCFCSVVCLSVVICVFSDKSGVRMWLGGFVY